MSKQTDAAWSAALRPVTEALIREEDVRRDQEHDRTHDAGGALRAERVKGRLPGNTTGVIAPESVQVPASALSASENLRDHLADVEAAIVAAAAAAAAAAAVTWSVMTNGDPANPEIVFVDGDVVMVRHS